MSQREYEKFHGFESDGTYEPTEDETMELEREERRHDVAYRVSRMIEHLTRHNWFDKQDLIQLLKDVKREL